MSKYVEYYEKMTNKKAPNSASNLDRIFQEIEQGIELPPRGQQAVNVGFTAHTLIDSQENPLIFSYYRWIINNMLMDYPVKELSAKLIGTSFTSANVFKTDLPQPVTLNQWQIEQMDTVNLMTNKAVILENNGVFILLHKLHPDWPLINQAGNDFNAGNNRIMLAIKKQHVKLTYLGDLDSSGIKIADHLARFLGNPKELFEIQSQDQVVDWLVRFGKKDVKRTREINIQTPLLADVLESIHTFGKFAEQEQLMDEYEILISKWLEKNSN